MPVTTTYTEAREKLAEFWDRAVQDREIVRITRRGKADVVLIAADEVESLLETAYLFRSPRNAERLLKALDHALARTEQPQTVDDLRQELQRGAESLGRSLALEAAPGAVSVPDPQSLTPDPRSSC